MNSSLAMTATQKQLKINLQNPKPVILLIFLKNLQFMKLVQVLIKLLKEILLIVFRKEVDNVVTAVENPVDDSILTAMDNVAIPRVEMAVMSIAEESRRGLNSVVSNPYQRDVSGNMESTALMTASSRTDLNIDQDRNDETGSVENFEDGDFPALRPNCDWQAPKRHRCFMRY